SSSRRESVTWCRSRFRSSPRRLLSSRRSSPCRLSGIRRSLPPCLGRSLLFLDRAARRNDNDVNVPGQNGNSAAVAPATRQLVLDRELEGHILRLSWLQLHLPIGDADVEVAQPSLFFAYDGKHRDDQRLEVGLLLPEQRLDSKTPNAIQRHVVVQRHRPWISERESHVAVIGDNQPLRLRRARAIGQDERLGNHAQVE